MAMALVYSCCFWFSLRLGGILISIFSIATKNCSSFTAVPLDGVVKQNTEQSSVIQASAFMIACCLAYTHSDAVKERVSEWSDHFNLIYSKDFMESVLHDPKKHILLTIVFTCVYLIACMLYVYGAYICNTILMLSFIILELLRLILISLMVATGLLLLKQNTMDIGSLIGASVVGGFFLLGMFYLWVCAANLPILINEMERDEQAATIAKLQQLLETNQRPKGRFDNVAYGLAPDPPITRNVFVVSNKDKYLQNSLIHRPRIPIAN